MSDARRAAAKIRRAVRVAAVSGWSMISFGAISAGFVVFGSPMALIVGGLLGAVGWNELRGGARLKRFDPTGARVLVWNQLALGLLIIAYGAWSLKANLGELSSLSSMIGTTGDPSYDALIEKMSRMMVFVVYGGVIIVGIVVPGLTALYYSSRGKLVRRFLTATPGWVVDTLRAAG